MLSFGPYSLPVLYGNDTSRRDRPAPSTTPSARAVGSVSDDARHVRSERRIDAVDTNRPDYDAVPEHDPDGTPWAA